MLWPLLPAGATDFSAGRRVATTAELRDKARLPFPVAPNLSGEVVAHWQTERRLYPLVFAAGGELRRSVYGSQEHAQIRLTSPLEERTQT